MLRCINIGFFFSSRRRHTRCLSDWSSDVCSSDLVAGDGGGDDLLDEVVPREEDGVHRRHAPPALGRSDRALRSEERRVGKECSSRWCLGTLRKIFSVALTLIGGMDGNRRTLLKSI